MGITQPGVLANHPLKGRGGRRPGTWEGRSDAGSRDLVVRARDARRAYPVDAIMCGNRVVWLSRDMVEQQVRLSDPDGHLAPPPRPQRGNRVHAGAAAAEGQD